MLASFYFLLTLSSTWGRTEFIPNRLSPPKVGDTAHEDAEFIKTILEDNDIQFKIAKLATSRSYSKRIAISREYERLYNVSLVEALMLTALRGETGKLIQGLFSTSSEFYAMEINRSVRGLGTDEKALNDVLCCLTDLTVDEIRYEYRRLFGRSMDEDIIDDVSGPYEKLVGDIIAMMRLPWQNEQEIVQTVTNHFADVKNGSVPDGWFFARSLHSTIQLVSDQLKDAIGINLPDYFTLLREKYKDDLSQLLWSIASFAQHPRTYYGELLWKAYEEDDNERLTRIIVSQSNSKRKLLYLRAVLDQLAHKKRTVPWMVQVYPSDMEPFHRYIIQKLLLGEAIEEDFKSNIEFIPQQFPIFFRAREYFRNYLADLAVFE